MPPEDDAPQADLTDLEAALGALRPGPLPHRDRILYRAGQAAGRLPAGRRGWPALAAGLAAVALGEGVLLARRPPVAVVERVVFVPSPPPAPAPTPAATNPPLAVAAVGPTGPVAASAGPAPMSPRGRQVDRSSRWEIDLDAPFPPAAGSSRRPPLLSGRSLLRREIQAALSSEDRS